ncbi:serine hydroxymethyltransferase [archaeon]|nr:serine hydroxymethyltransferase [archaeon]NCQ51665.1 serine hydroxymethyltransferase [archaeon]
MIDLSIVKILEKEKVRQATTIELIASENFVSKAVMDLCGSEFTNKYAEGLPGKRYYNGCENVDEIEVLAITYLKNLFGCEYANVQPHSGANANFAVFKAFLSPNDTIVGMDLSSGGHLSHGASVNISGAWFNSVSYGVNSMGLLDYEEIQKLVLKENPKMVIAGASAYSQIIDWKKFKEIADSVGAILLADVSHYSGLIVAKEYPNPLPYADVVTSTTHKTLRGPRGGVIMWMNESFSKKINGAVFPGTQGGPLMHIIAAKAQCFYEASQPEFKLYARQIKLNSKAMAKIFKANNIDIVSGGTESHMMTIDLTKENISGKEYANLLEANGITVNKNGVPNDKRGFVETSGIRIGVAAETTRGHKEDWFEALALKMIKILKG